MHISGIYIGLRPTLSKRSSISSISSLITGAVDPLATVPSLKTLGALAPHKSLSAVYGKMASVGVVHHPSFTSGCYVINSRANTFAILQVQYVILNFCGFVFNLY